MALRLYGHRSRAVESGWNRRLWRRLARAPEAVVGCPVGRPLPGCLEPPRAARRALRKHRSRAGALPRGALWPCCCASASVHRSKSPSAVTRKGWPGVPSYAVGTARPRLGRVARTYSMQEAGTRGPYVHLGLASRAPRAPHCPPPPTTSTLQYGGSMGVRVSTGVDSPPSRRHPAAAGRAALRGRSSRRTW
eukprot:scaffold121206_cov60-Phaeocystis_antarctica.AAC.2